MEIKEVQINNLEIFENVLPGVFDDPLDSRMLKEFLSNPHHHIVVACVDSAVVGFASAVHYLHPDKTHPEMWLNEIGVASAYRGQGIGTLLLKKIFVISRRVGCVEAWTLTDLDNEVAQNLYSRFGGIKKEQIMYSFYLEGES
jgi:ribosomal protein S18 acetylase RimI-like enzyme